MKLRALRTLLLADDEANLRTLVRTTLDDPAYRVLEASDGPAALALARQALPDLLLLDWMMPGMSGIEVLQALRADPRTAALPVIMLTARGQANDRERALSLGCQHFLIKPFSPLELLAHVQEILRAEGNGERLEGAPSPELTPELLTRLEDADPQLALYARDLKRAVEAERATAGELREANRRLETLSRLKTEFLSFVSHELRTPLNAISAVDLCQPGTEVKELEEMIGLVRIGYDRLRVFIEKGLEYFQWSAIERVTNTERLDMVKVVQGAIRALAAGASPAAAIRFAAPEGPCFVRGRPIDLGTVAKILLENALKFSRGAKSITVELAHRGDRIALAVTDSGVGVRAAMLTEIFQPLTSGDIAHHSCGTGLNLPLAKAIVEAHAGSISAASDGPGKGTTFTVELPADGSALASAAA